MNDPIASALSKINNAEKVAKDEVIVRPSSKLLKAILQKMQDAQNIGSFEEIKDKKGNSIKINLIGKVNKCGAIKPRFNLVVNDIEKFEERFLPAKGLGHLIITTPKGILTNEEAKEKHTGGKLVCFFY